MLLLKSSVFLFIKNIKCRNLRTKVEAFFRFSKIMGLKKVTSKVSTNNKKTEPFWVLSFLSFRPRFEDLKCNCPGDSCCHQCKHWWLPISISLVGREIDVTKSGRYLHDSTSFDREMSNFFFRPTLTICLIYCNLNRQLFCINLRPEEFVHELLFL